MNQFFHLTAYPEVYTYSPSKDLTIKRTIELLKADQAILPILGALDSYKGALFTSRYEYPGRYTRWDIGFVNPPIEIRSFGKRFTLTALNDRGKIILPYIGRYLSAFEEFQISESIDCLNGIIIAEEGVLYEEERTRQPSIFTVMRALRGIFHCPDDNFLGLYGAFAYDLIFQFEPMELNHVRDENQPDLVLYLPDELVIVDHQANRSHKVSYEFEREGQTTAGIPRTGMKTERRLEETLDLPVFKQGSYEKLVHTALEKFKTGDLFEVVPSHTLSEECTVPASTVFTQLTQINPSPYCFIINLGNEYLVGASPEMYVRVEGERVETCPISGTIRRGATAIEDSEQIRMLLNSIKDETELTMCTDVDRNDKSRICVPGTVEVIGRRQLEMYSHLIHTVDHVEGRLEPQFDSLDAFMTHMWAVTVTGAPKRSAVSWIERNEDTPRNWYGGAVGYYTFQGDLNTGLTLRTVRIKDRLAEIRVGATLLYDSVPKDEEQETLVKAAAMLSVIRANEAASCDSLNTTAKQLGRTKRVLLVDHEDSFVHTLANYLRQCNSIVQTLRSEAARQIISSEAPIDLVVLSPGPGRPDQFHLSETIELCMRRNIPILGVCLGLQGIVEYFGGQLSLLSYPQHGKSSEVKITSKSAMFKDMPDRFVVGRYHSLYASRIPDCLQVIAETVDDRIVMAIEHKELPIFAVQFHPESILSLGNGTGMTIIRNIINALSEFEHWKVVG
ncbi:anthranilate synthase [Paenibacillus curdlanolyticus YK9]|uniref:Anthranilate synthase n=1 Tax=Paenibacillus curdlanolyticus YK9 TaxID=717606 RepID=E0I5X6_9BACL|nr:anthranilate synthase component I [Paenibacillus curdlanolyticus]EFM12368.1 anthranilate synthase [Paenibacillus curdlanolyticus YK9]